MNDQLHLPELPPMQPSSAVSAPPAMSPSPSAGPMQNNLSMGVRRLRQALGYVAGGSFMLLLLICLAQLIVKPGLRPTDLMATMEAQTEIGIWTQRLGFDSSKHVVTETEYHDAIAEAQRRGAARAELDFQRQLAAIQSDKERVVQAYGALYQRTNVIAQAGVQMEAQALQFRQQLLASTNGGRAMVLSVQDTFCALGDQGSCDAGRKLRAGMIDESTTLSQGDLARKINELMAGVADPATFVTKEDQRRNGVPAVDRR